MFVDNNLTTSTDLNGRGAQRPSVAEEVGAIIEAKLDVFADQLREFSEAIADALDRMFRQIDHVVVDMINSGSSTVNSMQELWARFNQILLTLQQACISILQSQIEGMRTRVCFSPPVCCSPTTHSTKLLQNAYQPQ